MEKTKLRDYLKKHNCIDIETSSHEYELARFKFNEGLFIVYKKENGKINGNYWQAKMFYENFLKGRATAMSKFPTEEQNIAKMNINRDRMTKEAEEEDRIALEETEEDPKLIYLIRQTQADAGIYDEVVGAFSTEEEADNQCDHLNNEYEDDGSHYYEVEAMGIDDYFWTKKIGE